MAHLGDVPPIEPPRRRADDRARALLEERLMRSVVDLAKLHADLSLTIRDVDIARRSLDRSAATLRQLDAQLTEARFAIAQLADAHTDRPAKL